MKLSSTLATCARTREPHADLSTRSNQRISESRTTCAMLAYLDSSSTTTGAGMWTSERSVRCTGHIWAISNSRARCSPVSVPENCTVHSTRSSRPAFVSHSAQSAAWILECRSRTVTCSSGHAFRCAYSATVIDAQLPSAASRRSYGVGPVSVPPFGIGSSATRRCERAEISWAKPSPDPRTTTSVS